MAAASGKGDGPNGAALFEAANKLRGSVESAEYKHLVLGLLFLKYISDAFEQRRQALEAELSRAGGEAYVEDVSERAEVLEDRDEYVAENVFWVPEGARWEALLATASQPDVARRIDDALSAIEQENPGLRNVLPRVYARAPLSAELMGSLVETIAKIGFGKNPKEARDILGRTYEYFIKEFARAEGHRVVASTSRPRPSHAYSSRCWSRTKVGCSIRLWLVWIVHPVGAVHRGTRWASGEDLDLRPRAQPGHLANRSDEPRDPRSVR